MSINPLTFGSPVYTPTFAVSPGDTGVMKLRSRESSPLSHESLDENFTNLANKINEILGLKVDLLDIGTDGKMGLTNLALSSGTGIDLSATGQFSHQARPAADSGWSSADKNSSSLEFISGLQFDSLGHVQGYKSGNLSFASSGHIGVSNTGNAVTISSTAYGSGDSPTFGGVNIEGALSPELRITDTDPSSASAGTFKAEDSGVTLGAYTNHPLYLATNNTTAMTILKGGNVGIGRSDPTYKFEVKSEKLNEFVMLARRAGNKKVGGIYQDSTGCGTLGIYDSSETAKVWLNTNGDSYLTGGNVGIGTASPNYALDVQTTDNYLSQNLKINKSSSSNNYIDLAFQLWSGAGTGTHVFGNANYTSRPSAVIRATSVDSAAKGDLLFATFSGGANNSTLTEKMRIRHNGNVGIGTASPNAELEVNGQILSNRRFMSENSLELVSDYNDNGLTSIIAFKIDGQGAGNEKMRIDSAGNVGIGTTSPDTDLHVKAKDNTWLGGLKLEDHNSKDGWFLHPDTGGGLMIGEVDDSDPSTAVGRLTVKKGGEVGIGTTSPDYPLDVSGWISAKADAVSTDAVINLVAQNSASTPTSISRIKCIAESDTNSSSALAFLTRNSSNDIGERMRITSGGNVGIGVITNPETFDSEANQLVVRAATHAGMTIAAGTTSSRSNIYFADGNSGSSAYRGGITYDHGHDDLSFRAAGTEQMWLKANGRLGVNTSLPSSTFHVRGAFGDPATTGQDLNGIARFGQVQGAGVLDIGFGDPYSWIQSRASTDYSVNYDLALQPNGKSVIVGSKATPMAKLHVAQTDAQEPIFEIQYRPTEGGFYKHLGCVSHTGSHVTYPFVHVRLRTVWNDEGMFSIRARGYLPYGTVMDCTTGMYRYNSSANRYLPSGLMYHSSGNQTNHNGGIANVYNTNEDPGYLVLVVYWPTPYTGFTLEYFGGGGTYGWRTQHDIQIIDFQRTDSVNATAWA